MKCPSADQWDLLAMGLLEEEPAERIVAHARGCPGCRERFHTARREHTERVRMYEAFDRDHDELREQLVAALPDELPEPSREGWIRSSRRRLGGFAMSLNKTAGRRAAALLVPAACIVVAVAVLLAPKDSAFAAAVKHMRQASTIVSRYQLFMNDADEPMMRGTLYLSNEHGMRFDLDMGSSYNPVPAGVTFEGGGVSGSAAGMTIYHEPDGPVVMVQPPLNLVLRMRGLDQLDRDPRRTSPDAFIEKFLEMAGEADRELGVSKIEGRDAEGFEVSAKKLGLEYHGSGFEPGEDGEAPSDMAVRLWVDVQTNLPVRMEVEMDMAIASGRMLAVYDQFEWDVALADDIFVLEIPEGAQEIDLTIPPRTEETLVDALRLFAEATGRYPATLDPTSISMQYAVAAGARIASQESDPVSAVLGGLGDDALKMSMACSFVQSLAADGYEPEYFGDIVSPEDVDDVLIHWRLDNGQMRVIYGDLRAETVPATD
jgi:hypothetical protein